METPPRRPCVSPPPHPTNTNRLPPPLPLVTAAPLLLPQPPPEAPLSRVHQELVSIRRRVRGPTYSTGSVTDNESSLLLSLFALRSFSPCRESLAFVTFRSFRRVFGLHTLYCALLRSLSLFTFDSFSLVCFSSLIPSHFSFTLFSLRSFTFSFLSHFFRNCLSVSSVFSSPLVRSFLPVVIFLPFRSLGFEFPVLSISGSPGLLHQIVVSLSSIFFSFFSASSLSALSPTRLCISSVCHVFSASSSPNFETKLRTPPLSGIAGYWISLPPSLSSLLSLSFFLSLCVWLRFLGVCNRAVPTRDLSPREIHAILLSKTSSRCVGIAMNRVALVRSNATQTCTAACIFSEGSAVTQGLLIREPRRLSRVYVCVCVHVYCWLLCTYINQDSIWFFFSSISR